MPVLTRRRGETSTAWRRAVPCEPTGRVLTGAGVGDGVDENLDGVLVGQEVDDLKAVLDDPDSHELLTGVATVHHHRVRHPLHSGARRLPEPLHLPPPSSVGEELSMLGLDRNVIHKRNVVDLNIVKRPLAKQFDSLDRSHDYPLM